MREIKTVPSVINTRVFKASSRGLLPLEEVL